MVLKILFSNCPVEDVEEIDDTDIATTYVVGFVYSRTDLFGKRVKWFNHNIFVSIKPGECWKAAYLRQFGEKLEDRMQCFKSIL
mgnify:CR=1 FL=1